ncbi:hypothetical protein HNP37_002703 [Flavobacterium nitrogenifigens]|uniref:Lipoprotein n=2 Tax=Flavobacterium TaxID=237 RepID=A0A7W7IXW8_9FLAO|nr:MULTISPECIES: hypothetical protein [Flavobacterium]MBB4802628.1 hypothetical protein [Flavobacterium nitrogenifigens]MBB6387586.1 hypothetical protein [Flavobacterium notoginsengisoli]
MKTYISILIVVFFFSCQQKESKQTTVSATDSISKTEKKEIKTEENKQIGDTIFMNVKDQKETFSAEGSLDSLHSKIYIKFENEDLGELNASIIPNTDQANIRFSQIIFPNKTSDGPFARDLKIQLNQKGKTVLVIGHSLMAENPYYGKFKVELKHKKTAH